jgi:hypothetical protein
MLDDMSNHVGMSNSNLNWKLVDAVAAELGAAPPARHKWRQRATGVPSKWRIAISQELMKRGIPVALSDFDSLEATPGRIAA